MFYLEDYIFYIEVIFWSFIRCRKRVSNKNSIHSSGWKLARLETASSPSSLTSTYLEEMGIGVLDSEESSSSTASNITLGHCSSADENTNEATPNLDAPKMAHHSRLGYHNMDNSLLDITVDNTMQNQSLIKRNQNANLQLDNDVKIAEQEQHQSLNSDNLHLSAFIGNDVVVPDEQQKQKQQENTSASKSVIAEKSMLPQSQQNLKMLNQKCQEQTVTSTNCTGIRVNTTATKVNGNNTRSPLATVACHSFTRNSQQKQDVKSFV